MDLVEVESYYGKESADWVRERIVDGTFKRSPFVVRLLNPKYKGGFLKISDVIGYLDPYGLPMIQLPDHLRHSDAVRIEVENQL